MYPDTFSQYDEQQAIAGYFVHHKPGSFLDIGAWHPTCFSNTRSLYEAGWRGVMIDPSPLAMASLLEVYGYDERIVLVQAAVSSEEGILTFQITADSTSTSEPDNYALWKRQTKYVGQCVVRTMTWPQINNWFGGHDFVNLDAEGISVDLFHAMIASGAKPLCVCVEHDGRLAELGAAATAIGYKMIYANGTNAVFAK